MRPVPPTTASENTAIMRRLIGCMPASRYEMQTLCSLADICTTRSLPTAAVECTKRPRLLINPDFVKKYCQRDEHLFLLVMHELWHVMLAHTRMYPRMTAAQNIAFDAIINASLMREFNQPEYFGFFDAINPADKFPGCLLRPPEGWPNKSQYPDKVGPPGTNRLLMRLYPPGNGAPRNSIPLYEEVLNLLIKGGVLGKPVLIGSHDGAAMPVHDPYIKELMKHISGNWPMTPLNGRGTGGGLSGRQFKLISANEDARMVFAQTLRRALRPSMGRQQRRSRTPVSSQIGIGVLPNANDRLAPAKRKLGAPNTLWSQQSTIKARVPDRPSKSFVYLDVSGSMNFVLSRLLDLLLPYVAQRHADVFQFSTRVAGLSYKDLQQGKLMTTGGTDINCVLNHVLNYEDRVNRILVLTDGEVGPPMPHHVQAIFERNLRLHIVLPNGCNLPHDVRAIATSVVELPPIQ